MSKIGDLNLYNELIKISFLDKEFLINSIFGGKNKLRKEKIKHIFNDNKGSTSNF